MVRRDRRGNPNNFPVPRKDLPNLSKGNPTYDRLYAMIRDGQIIEDELPSDMRKNDRDFFSYELDRFRGAFNRCKRLVAERK